MTVTMPGGCVDGLLAGRYRLDERIAVGGMGEVWRGMDTVLARVVAVKCLKPEYVDDHEFRERFRAEARHAGGLSHPGIASVYDYGEQVEPETAAWLVMELVDGEPLSHLLHRTGRLSPEQALDVVGQTALALQAAHDAGVIHRDVKPGNLLVRPDGVVKITDFGIARAGDAVPLTRTGTVVGTAYYLSPEQATGAPVTGASDVYSLGVVAYECLSGERPFPGSNPVAVATAHMSQPPPPLPPDVPAPVADLVLQALAKDPAGRPSSAGELGRTALALRTVLAEGGDPTAALRVEPPAAARPAGAVGKTRALTALVPPAAAPVMPPRPARRAPSPASNHRRAVRLASALLAVVVLALSARACLAPSAVTVPTVKAGTSVDAATTALTGVHLNTIRATETSKTVATGQVTRTEPAAGSRAHEGDDVTVFVSSGPPRVTVEPSSYIGRSVAAVSAALSGLGLHPVLAYDGSGGPAGTVTGVTPAGSVTYGGSVTVHVVPATRFGPGKRKHRNSGGEGD